MTQQPLCLGQTAHEIYAVYPRKVGRPLAIKAIEKALRSCDHGFLLHKTEQFADIWNGAEKEELTYCPHPATWFNQERFNDDPSTWRPVKVKSSPLGPLRLRKDTLEKRIVTLEDGAQYDPAMGRELKVRREELRKVEDEILDATKG